MTLSLSQYRDTLVWQESIALGPHLIKLAEQLPEAEQFGLGQQLRQLMVELPGVIAMDLVDGSEIRLHVVLRLAAMLELIEHIYPALDGAQAQAALAALTDRLGSERFSERVTSSLAPEPEVAPAETIPPVDPTQVSVVPEPTQEVHHVQPSSGQ